MKNAIQRMKRALSLIMVIAMVMTMLPTVAFAAETKLYLKPNSNWTQANARFAAYFFGNGETWVSMTDSNGDGIYEVTVPTDKVYPSVIFCRMNPSATANNWTNKWNQTPDLTVPTDGTNLYTVMAGTWDKGGGTWSIHHTVYFINSGKWDEVYAYAWTDGGSGLSWPGVPMIKTDDTVNGFAVYTVTFETEYANIIFNNNNQGSQTADLTLNVGQYYDLKSDVWYESLADVPEVDDLATDAYLVGSFNGWNTSANEFKLSEADATVGTVSLELDANTTYEFKIVAASLWLGNGGTITDSISDWVFGSSIESNCTLTTTEAGTYVFTWDATAKALSVEYPQTEPTVYSVTFYGTNVTSNGEGSIAEGENYTATLTAAEGYTLPETVEITMGGYEAAYDYDPETGVISISNVTGDIVITAEGVEIPTEPETITVYFQNNWLWTDVYAYTFDSETNTAIGNAWPGVAMTLLENDGTYDIYYAEIPAGAAVIFNGIKDDGSDSRDQSPDITEPVAAPMCYYMTWDDGNKVGTFEYQTNQGGEEEEPGETATYTAIFHFANTIGWSPVNLYTWTADNSFPTGSWPGTAMTRQDENGYFTMTVSWEATSNEGLNYIFNNGSSQTKDLTLAAGLFDSETNTAEIWIELDPTSADSEGKLTFKTISSIGPLDGVLLAVSPRIDGTSVTFEYVGDDATTSVEVRGTVPDASWDAGIAMTKNEKGLWTVTVENLIPGIYEYKFVIDEDTWKADPANGKTNSEGNSVFTILDPTAEDINEVKIHVFYSRADGIYTQENADGEAAGTWNAYAWGNSIPGTSCDFAPDIFDVNGDRDTTQKVTTILVDGRKTSYVALKTRMSTEAKDWLREESEVRVNLDNIVSGNIFVYVVSDGQDGQKGKLTYSVVTGADIVIANKVTGVSYDYEKDTVIVTMLEALDDSTELTVVDTRDDTPTNQVQDIKVSGNTYTLTLNKIPALGELGNYKVMFDGYPYDISVDAVYASDRFAREYTYTGNDLGATWSADSTTFRVWAPTASAVSVNLYTSGTKGTDDLIKSVPMTADVNGTWVATVEGDLNGTYYTYSVKVNGDTVEAVDPYARTAGVNGDRGMVINLDSTDPDGWAYDKNPNPVTTQTDAVIYELHVRDFSIDDSSGMTNKGKYLAFTEEGTTIPGTEISTGIDYLDALGITHLHLLPVYDYGSVEETTSNTFNWGYDPKNYNVPEGSYSTNPYDGAVRVKEFKQMVKSLHDHDISVVMDVVYNHVYNADTFCFNNIVPGYFSRPNSNTSGCGNDTASEREMVRKYIVESVLYWHQEYHIDGFRFDLVGLLDVDTINQIVTEVHKCCPDVIFYGEGWDMDGTNKESGTEMAKQGNASKTPGFGYFSDSIRNQIAGSNGSSLGFVSGGGMGNLAAYYLAQPESWGETWTTNPTQVVQYASCHDNYTLIDKLVISTGASGLTDDIIRMNNLSAAIYMTAAGIPFIHAGEEFLREKLEEDGGRCENSYNASDYVNHIEWSNLEKADYAANVEYYKGLIAFRKAHAALRMNTGDLVAANIQTVKISKDVLAFLFDGNVTGDDDILVIFNAGSDALVTLPEGIWNVCVDGIEAGTDTLYTAQTAVQVEGISAMILTRADEGENEDQTGSAGGDTITVYFSNNKHWSNVYAHYWGGTTGTEWPGEAMTWVEKNDYGEDIYSINIPANTTGLLFHNNSGAQTVDITELVNGQGYYCNTESGGKWTCGTYSYGSSGGTGGFINDGIYEGDSAYYLFGYINGVDYASEGNGEAMGKYLFVNGQLTVCFDTDSYVGVKTTGNKTWYMTDGWLGNVTSATLYNTEKLGTDANKLLVPGGMEVTFTLTENNDGTVTLSYEADRNDFEDKSGIQDGVTLHCWNWSFDAITENMGAIAEMGYTAIQTSPIQPLKEATNGVDNTVGSHWWVYYQPVDFVITTDEGNALGTKTDFEEMCAAADEYGIQVIVDVVANHLGNKTGNDLADAIPETLRAKAYWHDITKNTGDYSNRYEVTQLCMAGLPDLNTANYALQQMVLDFLVECVDAGADGFRFDAAKHIETPEDDISFASDFWPTVIGGIQEYAGNDLYIYGEILDSTTGYAISDYTQYMSVTDNSWGNTLRSNVAAGIAALAEGYDKAADASNLVIWAESHDTYADGTSFGVSEANINKTWALVAARADAMGLYLARPERMDQALGVASATGWDNPEVKAVNDFHNAFVGEPETLGVSGDYAYVVRGNRGIVLVNVSGTIANVAISVPMVDGTYTDQITGNTFTVAEGKITGTIGNTDIAVIMPAEEKFDLYGANMDLGNKLDMNFYFLKHHITDTGSYAVITKQYADGSEVSKTIYASDFEDQSKDLYQVTFAGIAAKEMADTITVTIYDSNGKQISNIWEDSVRAYSMRMLEDATTDVERTVFVDMLNYGTEAQKYFKYNEDDYANSQLSETEQVYATVLDGLENNSSFDKSYYYGANMDLESSIKFNMYFVRSKVTTDMTVEISYTDHSGNAHEIVVKGSQFVEQSRDLWKVVVDGLVVADVKQIITVVVKDASGNEVTTIKESIESYLARQASASELYKAIMKFGLSANAYLHRNDK